MFIYTGKNPDFEKIFNKEFEKEYDSIEFANNNAFDYPIFEILDTDYDEVIYSNIIADDEEEATKDMMAPNDD